MEKIISTIIVCLIIALLFGFFVWIIKQSAKITYFSSILISAVIFYFWYSETIEIEWKTVVVIGIAIIIIDKILNLFIDKKSITIVTENKNLKTDEGNIDNENKRRSILEKEIYEKLKNDK
jgi:hypothetical protein